jgi:tripartite-type tricarboxylate transporter receptor subunit TctC
MVSIQPRWEKIESPPPGTAPKFVSRLNRELKDILAAPDVRAAFQTQGMDPATSTAS